MKDFKNWAISETENNAWNNHKFHQFLKDSTQEEFLYSQIPFFYAVQAFPRGLARLASMIETSEDRLFVIDNLSEEHGNGNPKLFHTISFKTFLSSLGWVWNEELFKNPWISEWIDKLLSFNKTPAEYAAYLAAIEYAYAPISETLANHIKSLKLCHEQSHYTNHAVLDWEHGYELLSVAYAIDKDEEKIKESFKQGQQDFLELYNHILIPTEKEIKSFHECPISFFYTREDLKPENDILEKILLNKQNPRLLLVASGGEHLLNALSKTTPLQIDVLDMNLHQIYLCQAKLGNIISGYNANIINANNGKFEKVFECLRNHLGQELIKDLFKLKQLSSENSKEVLQKLRFVMNVLFSNKNLSFVFGDKATQYTQKSFADHFYSVFVESLTQNKFSHTNQDNISNILMNRTIQSYSENLIFKNKDIHTVKWIHGNYESLNLNEKYDFIDVSNIGDWLSVNEFKDVLQKLKQHLNHDGYILCRKLLGDYDLHKEIEDAGFHPYNLIDETLFYTEIVVGHYS